HAAVEPVARHARDRGHPQGWARRQHRPSRSEDGLSDLTEGVTMRIQAKYLQGAAVALLLGVAAPALSAPSIVDTRLVTAAESQDKTAIQSLLQNGAYVGGTQPDGTTALHWAVHWGDLESAELLMLFGADLTAKNDYGARPL